MSWELRADSPHAVWGHFLLLFSSDSSSWEHHYLASDHLTLSTSCRWLCRITLCVHLIFETRKYDHLYYWPILLPFIYLKVIFISLLYGFLLLRSSLFSLGSSNSFNVVSLTLKNNYMHALIPWNSQIWPPLLTNFIDLQISKGHLFDSLLFGFLLLRTSMFSIGSSNSFNVVSLTLWNNDKDKVKPMNIFM